MKRYLLILLYLLAVGCSESDAGLMMMSGGTPAAAGLTTTCAGWSTDCAATTYGTNNYIISSGDHTDGYRWAATRDGTATRIRFRCADYHDSVANKVALYSGTTLIGTATVTHADNTWVWSTALVVEGGQSLTFAQNAVLRICMAIDDANVNGFQMSYSTAGSGNWWDYSTTYAPATITWSSAELYAVAIQLEYQY